MTNNIYYPQAPVAPVRQPEMAEYLMKRQIDTACSIQKKETDIYLKMKLEEKKAEIAQRHIETIEQNRRNHDNLSIDITENPDKKLYAIANFGQGSQEVLGLLYGGIGFVSMRYFSTGNKDIPEVLYIRWEGCEEGIYLAGRSNTPLGMEKALLEKGLALQFSRRRNREIRDAVYAFFARNAERKEIPGHFGWNRMSSGEWIFEPDRKKTLGGMLDEC